MHSPLCDDSQLANQTSLAPELRVDMNMVRKECSLRSARTISCRPAGNSSDGHSLFLDSIYSHVCLRALRVPIPWIRCGWKILTIPTITTRRRKMRVTEQDEIRQVLFSNEANKLLCHSLMDIMFIKLATL